MSHNGPAPCDCDAGNVSLMNGVFTRLALVAPCLSATLEVDFVVDVAEPPPPPQAELQSAPAPEPEVRRGGLFGMSFDVGGNAPGGQGRTP